MSAAYPKIFGVELFFNRGMWKLKVDKRIVWTGRNERTGSDKYDAEVTKRRKKPQLVFANGTTILSGG